MIAHLKNILLVCACIWIVCGSVSAQSEDTSLQVAVKDQFGGSVRGATIVLIGTGSKDKQQQTNSLGIAQFQKLTAGEYRLVVTAPGFSEFKGESFTVRNGERVKIDIVLEIASIESKVEVGENDNTDAEKTGVATVLNEKEIAALPDNPEDLERVIRRIGESVTGEELPISVNGVEGGKIPPKEAIQQIRVNQNVFSAQYDGAYGGGIEIFTRSNVDKFRTYLSYSFADSRLNAADPFLQMRVPYQARSIFFNLSGPLVGKKANFFIYGSHGESDSSAVINAIVLDANLNPVEFRQTLATPGSSDSINFTVNADPTKKHKLYFGYWFTNGRSEGQNVGGFSLPSRANESRSQSHFFQFSDTFLINPNVVNQTRLLLSNFTNDSFGGSNEVAVNVLDAFFGGGSQQNIANRNFRFEAANDTTWQIGRYALGLGFRIRGEHIDQNSAANFGGTYTFSGRVAPVLDANNEPVLNDDGSFLLTQINSLESYRRTLLFQGLGQTTARIRELGGGANQFTISGGNPDIKASQYDFGIYNQHSYKISETVSASFGLRYENQTNISSNSNFAPRFGLIWAPKAKDKQKPLYTLPRISVGYGLFYNRFSLGNTVQVRQASDAQRAQYLVTDANILNLFPAVPTVDLLQQFAQPQTQRFIDPEYDSPFQSLLTITAAKKLTKGFSLNFTFSRGRYSRQSYTQNINAPLAGTFDPADPSSAVRPFGNVGNIYETISFGRTETNRFSVNLGFPQSQNFFSSLRYSFTKSKSNVVSASGSPFDPFDFSQEFGPSTFDGVHSIGGYFYYTLPWQKISIGTDYSISSGTRFNIFTGRDTNGDGSFSERPSFATDLNKPGLISTIYGVLDPNPSPTDALIPRNLGRGPSNFQFNGSISKSFGFHEDKANKKPPRQTLNFSLRVNNVFNIINKGNPVGNLSSPNFLRSLTGFSDGSIITINGLQQVNFVGRSMSMSAGFSF
ncbi:MAG: carboxypeptidase regulatory-like domain-containing protein [Pyrinomonadaceae bacterium]